MESISRPGHGLGHVHSDSTASSVQDLEAAAAPHAYTATDQELQDETVARGGEVSLAATPLT